jgi:hypothetical protein
MKGNRVTRPPNHTMMPTPPPAAHLAPSSTDMLPAPTVAAANFPPQDVVLVYTITFLMDFSKPTSSLGSTNTRLYLMAAASPGGLWIRGPKFTTFGVNLAGRNARAGAANMTPTWGVELPQQLVGVLCPLWPAIDGGHVQQHNRGQDGSCLLACRSRLLG